MNADSSSMFSSFATVTTLDITSLNTSRVTNMASMFADCASLTTIYA
ncbi:BspA family leucine-rich repeat surface protein [bacterium]|nr:BspA family leucine-rich repeat surface protein [bacterium]